MKGKIAAVCSAAAMATFGTIALAAPAQAADHIEACFAYPDGTPYAVAYTQIHVLDGANWVIAAENATDANGCTGYDLTGSYQLTTSHIYAFTDVGDGVSGTAYRWEGYTPDAPAEHGSYGLGNITLTCTPGTRPCPV